MKKTIVFLGITDIGRFTVITPEAASFINVTEDDAYHMTVTDAASEIPTDADQIIDARYWAYFVDDIQIQIKIRSNSIKIYTSHTPTGRSTIFALVDSDAKIFVQHNVEPEMSLEEFTEIE